MRFWHLLAILSFVVLVAVAQSIGQVSPIRGESSVIQSATGWSSLPPEAQRAIWAALEEDGTGWIQQAELMAPDGAANDHFGLVVAVSGSTAVAGAPWHTVGTAEGAAYVFVGSGGTWTQQAELTAPDGALNDHFGWSVAVDGSMVAVGAIYHTVGSNQAQGAVYVFVESGGTWTQQAELTASDGVAGDQFGYSVAISGSTLVVGATGRTVGSNTQQGGAYVFVQSGGTWIQQAELTATDGAAKDYFGYSVAVSGSTAVVGAWNHAVGSNTGQGAAYVFVASGGTWSQQAELTASDGTATDNFGGSVAISGSTAVVGALCHPVPLGWTCPANPGPGAAYVFVGNGSAWSQQAELTASDGAAGDYFGQSVTVDGSTAVVGANGHMVGSNAQQGAAYVFGQGGQMWNQQAELTASGGAAYDQFGYSVALSGSTAAVGAHCHRGSASNCGPGAAYVFSPSAQADFTIGASPTTVTISSPRQSETTTITITPSGGFNQTITFTGASCSGLPTGASCSFNPASVTPNGGPASTTLTFATTAASAAIQRWSLGSREGIPFALAVPALFILGAGGRGKRNSGVSRAMMFLLLIGFSVISLNGCGGGSGAVGTPAGTYTIMVTARTSGLSHSTSVTLTVQ